jgi:hypothetical protein
MSGEEEQQQPKKETKKRTNLVSMLRHGDQNFLIVDIKKRNRDDNEEVLYVSHWGKSLEKGEKPTEEHVFRVKTFQNKKHRKTYKMTRSATTGKFKMYEEDN